MPKSANRYIIHQSNINNFVHVDGFLGEYSLQINGRNSSDISDLYKNKMFQISGIQLYNLRVKKLSIETDHIIVTAKMVV